MAATYKELKRLVMLGMPRVDGEAVLVVEQAVNDAIQAFAKLEDFDEMLVRDTTSADTVDGTKSYHLTSVWALTRPKDILSIILEDEGNSRKLTRKDARWFDSAYPYPEQFSEARSEWYIPRGLNVTLFPIPDAAYDLHIYYSQFPAALSAETDANPFINFDQEVVFLSKKLVNAYLDNVYVDSTQAAKSIISGGIAERKYQPDREYIARPFKAGGEASRDNYWLNPLTRKV